MLALRLIWGLLGTEEARFSSFPPSFSAAVRHAPDLLAGKRQLHRSHNPLGALMVYALWGTLAVVLLTGVLLQSRLGGASLIRRMTIVSKSDQGSG